MSLRHARQRNANSFVVLAGLLDQRPNIDLFAQDDAQKLLYNTGYGFVNLELEEQNDGSTIAKFSRSIPRQF